MSFSTRQYFRNWGLYVRGVRWLWTRRTVIYGKGTGPLPGDCGEFPGLGYTIRYKPGYGPWRFLPIYLSTYLLGTLCGFGVVSISRAATDKPIGRLIDRAFALFGQENHCANAGPWLWGSRSAWE